MANYWLDSISHRRYNPLRGSHVLVSPHRTKRPWQGQEETVSGQQLPLYDSSCYLCPGNKRAQGDVNPRFESTFVFENDYSALSKPESVDHSSEPDGDGIMSRLLKAEPVSGKCYVLVFNAAHNVTLADLSPEEIVPIIDAWTDIYSLHLAPELQPLIPRNTTSCSHVAHPEEQYRYMQIFENKGASMGCSNPHPHGQIWTISFLPEEPAIELKELQLYRQNNSGKHMLEEYVMLESKLQERTVFENDTFLVHKRSLVDLNKIEIQQFAEAFLEVTKRYDNIFETHFPYSMGIHQAALNGSEDEMEASHLHVHFYPPLLRSATVRKFLVGYEMLAEPQCDITPEQAAKILRDCGGPRRNSSKEHSA